MTQPVVALERPTWSLTMMGVLMEVPTRVFLLQTFDSLAEALQLLHLDLGLLLVDINNLQLSTVGALPSLALPGEGRLLCLDDVPGDGTKLSILSDLVGRSGTHGVTVHIDGGLLPQVEPDDGAILGVDAASHFLQDLLESLKSWLTTAVDLEARNSAEVWNTWDGIRKLLYLVKVVGHTDRLLHVPHGVRCEQSWRM